MSKSPIKDFSRLIETSSKTAKKETNIKDEPAYPSKLLRYDNNSIVNDLKAKLDAALRHNTRLLDENSTLGEMANELRYQLKSKTQQLTYLQKQSEDLLRKTSNERENLQLELQVKQGSHQDELNRLLKEISNLHDEKNNLELGRQQEIDKLKIEFQASLLSQLQNVRNCQNNSKQLYDAQIRNLKELLEDKQREVEGIKSVQKMEKNRLQDSIRALEKELAHTKKSHQIELKGLKHSFAADFESEKKRIESEKSLQLSSYNLKIKRLKKDVAEKGLQLQHMSKKMSHQEELLSMEGAGFKRQKDSLLSELKSNDLHAKNLLDKEKTKLEELNRLEVQNLTKLFQTNIEQLNGENFKLKQLIECKKEELRELYDENQRIKESYGKENELVRGQNSELKQKIRAFQLEKKEEMETFKIKMASLLENDIKVMSNYYENQIKAYIDRTTELSKINAGLRERIFTAIQDNDVIRKNFQIQNAKLRARVQDLKIKIASLQLEHKEQVSNLGSKVQLTSQTLIRQTQHKDKTKSQYEQQKKKFHYLANSKDKEISDLMAMMDNMKRMHEDELVVIRAEKIQMKTELIEAEQKIARIRAAADEEIRVKEERLKTLVFDNEKEMNEIKELQDKIQVLEKNLIKAKKQYEHLQLINSSLAQELGLSKGFIESLQMESNAAIEDERVKMKAFIGTHEVSIKEYFEDKLKSKEKDVESLTRQLSEKEETIRQLLVQYAAMEKRFEMMMETTSKLRQFQEQIKHLGLDTNLVKNMAELFKKG